MKDLELTIFPPVPPNPRPDGPLTRLSPEFSSCMEWDLDRAMESRQAERKHLSEQELAAEYWYFHHFHSSGGQGLLERCAALHRFATLPHYDGRRV